VGMCSEKCSVDVDLLKIRRTHKADERFQCGSSE
jgi:hypothetical protein